MTDLLARAVGFFLAPADATPDRAAATVPATTRAVVLGSAQDALPLAADPDTPLARAALAGLSERCVSALACRPLRRGLPRALALAGLAGPPLDPPLCAAAADST